MLRWNPPRSTELANTYLQLAPDILLLNSHGETTRRIKLFPYKVYQCNKRRRRLGGGVAIAIKSNIPHTIIDDFDSDLLAIRVTTAHGDIIIATCYRPPSQGYLPTRDLHRLAALNQPVYLLGDFNANHRLFGYRRANRVGSELARLIACGEWTHLGPPFKTFYGYRSATTPDIVLCNRHAHLNFHMAPGPLTSSDHVPVILTLSTNPIAIPTAPRHDYANANWDDFKTATIQHLADHPLQLNGRPLEDIDAAITHWYQAVEAGKTAAIPRKRFRVVPHPTHSDTLRALRVQFLNLVALGDARGWDRELYHRQKQLQRDLLMESKRLASQKWEEMIAAIAEDVRDPAKFWNQVDKLRGEKSRSSNTYLKDPGVPGPLELKVHDDVGKERLMRDVWSKVFQISPAENRDFDLAHEREVLLELERRGDELSTHQLVDLSRLDENNELTRPFDAQDISRIIKAFKNRKAPGNSGIAKRDLVHLPVQAQTYLADIFNACLSAGYFPRKFKSAVLIFIPKDGDPHDPHRYRPISLLEVPGKILERGLNERIVAFVEDLGDQGFNPLQYGFRERRGTGKAIAVTYELISIHAAKPHGRINVVLRDLEKAFDKVWHQGLRHRLLELQFPDLVVRILSSFLSDRTASIKMGSVTGEEIPLQSGVPQGSVLSPTLFILYTADTPPPTVDDTYVAFADDHNQLCEHHAHGRRQAARTHARRTATAITRQNRYHRKKKIRDNYIKLKVLTPRRRPPVPLTVEGTRVPYATEGKLLGLRMTNQGCSRQARHNRNLAGVTLTKLRRFSAFPNKIKLHLYKTLVRPQLEYPAVPLHVASPTSMGGLQAVQNRALQWVHGVRWPAPQLSARELHLTYKVEPLNCRLWRLARRIWERLLEDNDPMLPRIDYAEGGLPAGWRDHSWWPRSRPRALGPMPRPLWRRGQ